MTIAMSTKPQWSAWAARAARGCRSRAIGTLALSAIAFLAACGQGTTPVAVAPTSLEQAAPAPAQEASQMVSSAVAPAPGSICVPIPISPVAGATMDNGRTDGGEEVLWDFDWSDCAGATRYGFRLRAPGEATSFELEDLAASSYRHYRDSVWIDASRLTGWTWQVRADVGIWGNWSAPRSFDVEPPNTDPRLGCIPTLVSPASGATLDNGRTDGTNGILWNFAWSGCAGATHQLRVVRAVFGAIPAVDEDGITASEYRYSRPGAYISATKLSAWMWAVRAWTGGRWGEWSEWRRFRVEAPNTDPPPAGR